MESHKSKVLRIIKTIYDIIPGTIVKIIQADNTEFIGKCKCIDGNYDIYDFNDNKISWRLSCDTLDDMRDSLLLNFINTNVDECYINDIKIV